MSVKIFSKLEVDLRQRFGQPDLVLADDFSFLCGTSTAAVIATPISAGMSMAQLRDFSVGSGSQMFEKASFCKLFLQVVASVKYTTNT